VATKGTKSEPISVQDMVVQSQALLNIKDSNKVLLFYQVLLEILKVCVAGL